MKKTLCFDEDPILADNSLKIFTTNIGTEYDVFLNEIREPEYYGDLFYILKTAKEEDTINLVLNTHGGNADTVVQLRTRIRECKGIVVGSAEGFIASAGPMIFLACNAWNVGPNISFMAHNYSGGVAGKGGEIASQVDFEKLWSRELMYDCYKGFLTDKEIEEMLAGKDFWMGSKEVSDRLTKLVAIREKEFKKAKK